jgi:hypothetical protein
MSQGGPYAAELIVIFIQSQFSAQKELQHVLPLVIFAVLRLPFVLVFIYSKL